MYLWFWEEREVGKAMDGHGTGRMTTVQAGDLAFLCVEVTKLAKTMAHIACRLYSKGRILGHKRAKRNSRPNTTLIQIEGVATKEDAQFYLGKVC